MCLEITHERPIAASRLRQLRFVFVVGKQLNAVILEHRLLGRQRPGFFVLRRQAARRNFARLDIRLVKGVDPNNRSGDGCGDFPAEKFLPNGMNIRHRNTDNGMPGLFQSCYGGILTLVWF